MSRRFLRRSAFLALVGLILAGATVLLSADTRSRNFETRVPSDITVLRKSSMLHGVYEAHPQLYQVCRLHIAQPESRETCMTVQAYSARDALARRLAIHNAVDSTMQVMLGAFRASKPRATLSLPPYRDGGI